jgi:hypothetical protein
MVKDMKALTNWRRPRTDRPRVWRLQGRARGCRGGVGRRKETIAAEKARVGSIGRGKTFEGTEEGMGWVCKAAHAPRRFRGTGRMLIWSRSEASNL